ncbi:MAG: hypothetical protein M1820_006717 [Bogoriella megaspora]|nr:MAG: hypothetical protein M1820_006717 [Bogoriella megaspora]
MSSPNAPSSPIEELQHLSISSSRAGSKSRASLQSQPMVRTRSGAGTSRTSGTPRRIAATTNSDSDSDSDSYSSSEDENEDEITGVETDLGIQLLGHAFNYEEMTPATEERARRAFDADELTMSHCRAWRVDGTLYFNFNLREQIGIRIGPVDEEEDSSNATCTCGRPPPCKHIWWLEYQLVQARDPLRAWSFVDDASSISGVPLHEWIVTNDIEHLSEEGDWPLVPAAAMPGEDNWKDENGDLNDLLTPFAPFPEDETSYRDAFEALDQVVRTVAKADRGVFERFRNALDRELCAQVRFEKHGLEAIRNTFENFDASTRAGPASSTASPWRPVADCADTIEQNASFILRAATSDFEDRLAPIALRLLLQIVHGVVTRNMDIYIGKPWASRVQAPTDTRERNLYVRLIRSPFRQSAGQQLFLIDELRRFPPELLGPCRNAIVELMDLVRRNGGPDRYHDALRDLIAPNKGSIPPGRAVGQTSIGKKRIGEAESSSQAKRGK